MNRLVREKLVNRLKAFPPTGYCSGITVIEELFHLYQLEFPSAIVHIEAMQYFNGVLISSEVLSWAEVLDELYKIGLRLSYDEKGMSALVKLEMHEYVDKLFNG